MSASKCSQMLAFRPNRKQLYFASVALVLGQSAGELELYEHSGIPINIQKQWKNSPEFQVWLSRVFKNDSISVDLDPIDE